MTNGNEIVQVGVDWLTITAVEGDGVDDLMAIAFDISQAEFPRDVLPKKWSGLGYTGKDYGPMKVGTRDPDQAILMITGEMARRVYPGIPIKPERVSRIDLQVTVKLEEPRERYAISLYETFTRLTSGRDPDTMFKLVSSATGDTLYHGKRSHAKYLRFYDKSKDLGFEELGTAWRYEVEYKKHWAKKIASTVATMNDPYADVASLVWQEFKQVGFKPVYERGQMIRAMEVGCKFHTIDGKVQWLERCVAPVVTQLIQLGLADNVIESLGLLGAIKPTKEK